MYYRKPAMILWFYMAFVLIRIRSTNVGGKCFIVIIKIIIISIISIVIIVIEVIAFEVVV